MYREARRAHGLPSAPHEAPGAAQTAPLEPLAGRGDVAHGQVCQALRQDSDGAVDKSEQRSQWKRDVLGAGDGRWKEPSVWERISRYEQCSASSSLVGLGSVVGPGSVVGLGSVTQSVLQRRREREDDERNERETSVSYRVHEYERRALSCSPDANSVRRSSLKIGQDQGTLAASASEYSIGLSSMRDPARPVQVHAVAAAVESEVVSSMPLLARSTASRSNASNAAAAACTRFGSGHQSVRDRMRALQSHGLRL